MDRTHVFEHATSRIAQRFPLEMIAAAPLYRAYQVLAGAFFGGPLAATLLVVSNYRSVRRHSMVAPALLLGLADFAVSLMVRVLLYTASFHVAYLLVAFALGLVNCCIFFFWSDAAFGARCRLWRARGGRSGSTGMVLVAIVIGFALQHFAALGLLALFAPGLPVH